MAICLHRGVEDIERGGMKTSSDLLVRVLCLTDWAFGRILTASSPPYRTTFESEREQRHSRGNTVRDIQCSCIIHVDTGGSIALCLWKDNRDCPRRW